MSNTDFDFNDPISNMAVDRTVSTLDDDPAEAARAIELGDKTGHNPVAIHADLESYENNIKAATTASLIRGNRSISDYINSHPLAGIVSNGDLHKLNEASEKMHLMPVGMRHWEPALGYLGNAVMNWPKDFKDMLVESAGSLTQIPKDITKFSVPAAEIRKTAEAVRREGPNWHNITSFIGAINNAAMFSAPVPGMQNLPVNVGAQDLVGGIFGLVGTVTGIMPTIRTLSRESETVTGVPKEFTEQAAMLGMMFFGLAEGKGRSFSHGGEAPPPGINKQVDSIREFRSKENLKTLDEATRAVQGTQTAQMAQSLARDFVGQHVGDRSVYINVEAVQRLYGEKIPHPDDNLLGWAPGIADELASKAETGGTISIPLKDWLTRVDPEVAKALHDDMKVMKDDITVGEAQALKEHGELMPPPPDFAPDMTRRGFLKGLGATVAAGPENIAKGAKSLVEGNPFEGADLSAFAKNVEHEATKFYEWWDYVERHGGGLNKLLDQSNPLRQMAEEGTLTSEEAIRRQTIRHLESNLREELIDGPTGRAKVLEEAIKKLESGWVPSPEAIQELRNKAGLEELKEANKNRPAEGEKSIEERMADEGHEPEVIRDISQLPLPDEYMKNGVPKTLTEPGPLGSMRRFQQAVDETRQAARLTHFMPAKGKLKLDLVAKYEGEEYKPHEVSGEGPTGIGTTHEFNISREGKPEGYVNVTPLENGKLLHIDYGGTGEAPWKAGFQSVADQIEIARELKLIFPEAEDIGGFHVSGRGKGEEGKYTRVSLSNFAKGWEVIEGNAPAIQLGKPEKFVTQTAATTQRYSVKSIGTTTIKQAFDQLDLTEAVGGPIAPALRVLADRVANKVGHVLVHIVSNEEFAKMAEGHMAAAFYNAATHHIVMPKSTLHSNVFGRVLLHEAIHAATSRVLHLDTELSGVIQQITDHIKTLNPAQATEYGFTNAHEFLAEAMSNPKFQQLLIDTKISPELADALGVRKYSHVKTLWDSFINAIANFLGVPDKPEIVNALEVAIRLTGQAFDRSLTTAEMLRIGQWREALAKKPNVGPEKAKGLTSFAERPKEPELPGMTRMEDRKAFKTPSAVGITKEWYARYQELIAKQESEDAKKRLEVAIRRAEQIQTKEWREASERISKEVEEQVRSRPDIAVDEALRKGTLGEGTAQPGGRRLRLNADALTEEQKAALDKSEYSKDGVNPDDLATYFGYPSGDAMLERLGQLRQFIEQGPYANSEAYIKAIVREDTARRMEQEFGDLGKNILDEARDHVTEETQLDLMHEELVGLAMAAKMEFSITKEQMKEIAKTSFDKAKMGDVSTAEFLRQAGKWGIELEKAMLEEDYKTAFKAKQMQTLATMMAQEAKKVEKAKKVWDRNAKRFAKRKVAGIDQRYTNAIHDILMRTGATPAPRRTAADLADSFRRDGLSEATPLRDFVDDRREAFRELAVPDWLTDPKFQKDFDQLTAAQFRDANDAVKSLIKNGRDENKVISQGEAADLIEVMEGMREQIADLPIQKAPIDRPEGKIKRALSTALWSHINLESMMNRLDRGNVHGLFKKYIMFPIAEASNTKDAMIKKYQKEVSEIGKIPDLDKKVENTLFIDSRTGEPHQMRRRNVLGIVQIYGDLGARAKLLKGHNIELSDLTDWLKRNTTKEDWDRARKIGDIFDDLFEQAARMQHELSGVAPVKSKRGTFIDPHGVNRTSWHNPIRYDRQRPGTSPKLIGRSALEEEGYYRATTPTGYLEERTGYTAEFDLTLDIVPIRMRQMIHDITMRPAVIQASKFFYNPYFERLIRKYYGDKPVEEFVPFLRDIANSPNYVSFSESIAREAFEYFRQNMITTLIGLNPGTVMKHGTTALFNSLQQMGYRDFATELATLMRQDSTTGKRNWTMAFEKSEELQRRMRNFQEIIAGHGAEINLRGARSTFGTFRELAMQIGATPVATSDLLSSVPTWLVAYKRALMAGETEGHAIAQADLAVRQTHGSSVMSNKPSVMRSKNPIVNMYASLYGFFNHMFQKQYEMAWKARDAVGLAREGELREAASRVPELASLFLSYVIIPAVIEELVTPYTNSDRDSWAKKIAKTLAFGISSSTIGVRDFVHGFIGGRDAEPGLAGSMLRMISDLGKDVGRLDKMSEDQKAKMIRHVFSFLGLMTGLTNTSEGKAIEYYYRVNKGMERPKGPWGHMVGMRYGTTKGHSPTLEDYVKHLKGH